MFGWTTKKAIVVSQKHASMPSRACGSPASVTATSVAVTITTPRIRLTATTDASGGGGHSISPSVMPVRHMAKVITRRAPLAGWRVRMRYSSLVTAMRV